MASFKTGSWVQLFYGMVCCDVLAALLALFWLKPVAKTTFLKTVGPSAPGGSSGTHCRDTRGQTTWRATTPEKHVSG